MSSVVKHLLRPGTPGKWTVGSTVLVLFLFVPSLGVGQAQAGSQATPTASGQGSTTGTQPGAGASQEPVKMTQSPTASTQVDEVALDLVVLDKSHKPVRDLKPEDLVITDNNTPVQLKGLRLVSGDAKSDHQIGRASCRERV